MQPPMAACRPFIMATEYNGIRAFAYNTIVIRGKQKQKKMKEPQRMLWRI